MQPLDKKLKVLFGTAALSLVTALPANAVAGEKQDPAAGPFRLKAPAVVPMQAPAQAAIPPERVVRLYGPIDDELAHNVREKLLRLEAEAPGQPIEMRINSPGGDVSAGLMIFDTMKGITSPVATTCESMCASMAAVILAGGTPGMRTALPSSVVMIHELTAGLPRMKYSNLQPWKEYVDFLEDRLVTILSDYTSMPKKDMAELIRKDMFYPADKAKDMGLIDKVIAPVHAPPQQKPKAFPPVLRRVS